MWKIQLENVITVLMQKTIKFFDLNLTPAFVWKINVLYQNLKSWWTYKNVIFLFVRDNYDIS